MDKFKRIELYCVRNTIQQKQDQIKELSTNLKDEIVYIFNDFMSNLESIDLMAISQELNDHYLFFSDNSVKIGIYDVLVTTSNLLINDQEIELYDFIKDLSINQLKQFKSYIIAVFNSYIDVLFKANIELEKILKD